MKYSYVLKLPFEKEARAVGERPSVESRSVGGVC